MFFRVLGLVAAAQAWAGVVMAGDAHLSAYSAGRPPEGAASLCRSFPHACQRGPTSDRRPVDEARFLGVAASVNRAVNAAVSPGTVGENPWRVVERGSGDCTNYVTTKKQQLVAAGIPADRLLAAVVVGREDGLHAVLVLRLPSADVVLDNLTDRILPWMDTGYTFLKMQNPADGARWDIVLMGPRASRSGRS
ncbi:transglutaminase-like cysteine peptidase [Alsobacter sp. R-9]